MSTGAERWTTTVQRLREILDAAADGMMVIDAQGTIELVNRAFLAQQATGREATEGMTILSGQWNAIHADGRQIVNEELPSEITRTTGQPVDDVEIGFPVGDESVRWISISTRAVNLEDGLPCAVVVTSREVTDQVAMRRQMLAAADHHRGVLDALQEGIVIWYADGRHEAGNQMAGEVLGADSTVDGRPDLASAGATTLRLDGTRMPPEEYPEAVAARTGKPVLGEIVCIRRRDGQQRWLSVSSRPSTVAGEPVVVSSFLDITGRHLAELARAESEQRLRVTLDSLSEGVILYDHAGRAVMSNVVAREILGFDETASSIREISGGRTMIDVEGRPFDPMVDQRAVRVEGKVIDGRLVGLVADDGHVQWLSTSLRPIFTDAGEGPYALVSAFLDVTESLAREHSLAQAEERFRTIFSMAPIGMGIVRNGFVVQANRAWAEIMGRTPDQLEGRKVDDFTFPGDPATTEAAVFLGDHARRAYRVEKRYIHAEGHAVWVQLDLSPVRDPHGAISYVIVQVQDIADRRRHQQDLEHLANHDALTGLLNRRGFQHALEDHVRHAARYGADGAMLMLDLDHFKYVNDTLGHKAGDELIVKAAELLASRLRESDVVARIGGDEFAILLPHGDREAAQTLATALVTGLREWRLSLEPEHGTAVRGLTASIGVAMVVPDAGADDLVVNADLAMYDAKEAGRDRWAFYTEGEGGDQPRMKARLSWLGRVRRAIEQRSFELFGQPIVSLRGTAEPMFEVLLRLRSDAGELISPGSFLSIAERVDLIQEIDCIVMDMAITALENADFPVSLSVNVSGKSVGDPRILAAIEDRLRDSHVSPSALIIEITETAAISQIEQARAFALALQRVGCRLAIDDFGAGFGSFTYLKHLPFNFLKIDGEFVAGAVHSKVDRVIVEAVRHMAHGLDRAVIGEHCSDATLVEFLRREGVDFAQGYHVGRPAPLDELLRRGPPQA
jgi:diguanylate cyclase (GGDEF)-like protein/PAS domain S-box-containing protein